MLIIGWDYQTRFQQIARLDRETGERIERRLEHPEEARQFYAERSGPVRVGMEASGPAPWFERMLAEPGQELWGEEAAAIRARVVRQQKTDSRDALPILDRLLTDRFPRVGMPSAAVRDERQGWQHRVKRVRYRTSVQNPLQALARGEGVCRRKKLWRKAGRKEREGLAWGPWASRRREELLEMLDRLSAGIEEWDQAVRKQAESCAEAVCLRKQPRVGAVTVQGADQGDTTTIQETFVAAAEQMEAVGKESTADEPRKARGLEVPQKQRPRRRLWLNDGSCIRLRPERQNRGGEKASDTDAD